MCSPAPPPPPVYTPPPPPPAPDLSGELASMQETINQQQDMMMQMQTALTMAQNKPPEKVVQTEIVRPAGAPLPQMAPDPAVRESEKEVRRSRKGRSSMRIKRKKQTANMQASQSGANRPGGGTSGVSGGSGTNVPY